LREFHFARYDAHLTPQLRVRILSLGDPLAQHVFRLLELLSLRNQILLKGR
jgi:hypothetical protein